MAQFNADFWEIPAGTAYLENIPAERGLWFETEEDRERRYAMKEFFASVLPAVSGLIEEELTARQKEVLTLYFFDGKTQEDIADILKLSQSTVSRHLFGTVRNGKKVGGAIPKLQKVVDRVQLEPINNALATLKSRFSNAA